MTIIIAAQSTQSNKSDKSDKINRTDINVVMLFLL